MGVVQINIGSAKSAKTDSMALVPERAMPTSPIFDTPAIVGYLTLVVALAVYLRTVSASLTATIEALLANPDHPLWTQGSKHREDKLTLLRNTRRVIQRIAPVIFTIAIFASGRLLFWAIAAAYPRSLVVSHNYGFDLLLSGALVVMVVAMFVAHLRMSFQEKKIRTEMEAFAARQVAKATSAA